MRPQLVLVGVILVLFVIFLNSSTFFSPNYSLLKVEALRYANYFFYPENYHQIELPKINGPESFAFDCHGKGPYTGVSDGRVLKWEGPIYGWKEFAITSPNRCVCVYIYVCMCFCVNVLTNIHTHLMIWYTIYLVITMHLFKLSFLM